MNSIQRHIFILIWVVTASSAWLVRSQTNAPIPWDQLGAKAGADYKADGLAVTPTRNGAKLRCEFQRLEGEATREGLWLTSTVTHQASDRFRVVAASVGRVTPCATELPRTGAVQLSEKLVRFTRPGLVEEYSVSVDGVRQDFVIEKRPAGSGELRVTLAVDGARVEAVVNGAQLVLENSGRKIAYSRLRVTDAMGKELNARMEVLDGARRSRRFDATNAAGSGDNSDALEVSTVKRPEGRAPMLAVLVIDDLNAVYPVRIDPTFSDANWASMGGLPGANGSVRAAVVDGSGNLYIGGSFTVVGDVFANYIAKWNGSSWSALGLGVNGTVYALAVSGNDLYAAGYFTTAGGSAVNHIAKWDGTNWSALALGLNGPVYAVAVSGTNVYAGGQKWNGSTWSQLGFLDGTVLALAVSGSELYAGGEFTRAGGTNANYIAKWNGSNWSALGSGMNSRVYALAVSGSNLYAGGSFSTAGGSAANYIAKWNGSSWSPVGSFGLGINNYVRALAVSGGDLYAGGYFATLRGSTTNYIVKWNGSNWSALDSEVGGYDPSVSALAVSGSDLYAGGYFTTAGGSGARNIAKWNGSTWSAPGSGLNADVSALAVSSGDLYAGGYFTTAGGSAANYIAKWNGSSWSPLGSGMNSNVSALAVSGSDLYAAGAFTMAGGSAANYIAKWNGSSWSALGSGMNSNVSALAVSGGDLYAGGYFTTAGGSAANHIAKWNGSSWSALGSGMNNNLWALAVSGGDLYAGGQFTAAGGSAANYIAKWDGSSWSALGSGMGGGDRYPSVVALAVSGNDLYAGGGFTTAGGTAANYTAKWNGSSWSPLGSGMQGNDDYWANVYALAVSGNDVYAGGVFRMAGGNWATHIAKWNGSSWSRLGWGLNGTVRALAVSGSDLYAGGGFTMAGTKVSAYVARADLDLPAEPPFADVTATVAPGLPAVASSSVTWADYDNDGRLDFLLTGLSFDYLPVSQIWRNTGNGFTNVTDTVAPGLPQVTGGSVAWADYDNDGWLDFLLTGYSYSGGYQPVSQLWRNMGNGFENVTPTVAPGLPGVSRGSVAWGDYDNDGRLDFLLTGFAGYVQCCELFWRRTFGQIKIIGVLGDGPDWHRNLWPNNHALIVQGVLAVG